MGAYKPQEQGVIRDVQVQRPFIAKRHWIKDLAWICRIPDYSDIQLLWGQAESSEVL